MSSKSLLFVCQASDQTGLGHLTRLTNLIEEFKNGPDLSITLLVFGQIDFDERLKNIEYQINQEDYFHSVIEKALSSERYSAVIFDLCPRKLPDSIQIVLKSIHQKGIKIISIDSLYTFHKLINFFWIPSFFYNEDHFPSLKGKYKSGWDSLLIKKRFETFKWKEGNNLLILTGSSDPNKLSKIIPSILESDLPKKMKINWVKGPFSEKPIIPKGKHDWEIHENLLFLDDLISQSNYAVSVFGVSFFEVLQYGIPSIVFSPYKNKDNLELEALKKENVAIISDDVRHIGKDLNYLMSSEEQKININRNAFIKMKENGVNKLFHKILSIIK